MKTPISEQVVVVTGASGGIGRAVARAYGARHAKVAVLARGKAGLAETVRDVEAAGGLALALPTDVAHCDQVMAAAAEIEEALGPIDVWVNDAFTSVFAPFTEISAAEFARVTEVSYLGYVYGTMAALERMGPRNRGTIVQVGSALAYRGIPLQSAYCGAKHAIQGFHEALRCELLHDKSQVHVTMVQMPAVNTPQFSWVLSRLPRHAQPVPPIYHPRSPRGRSCMQPSTHAAANTGSVPALPPPWRPTRSPRDCSTATSLAPGMRPSRPTNAEIPTSRGTCGHRRTIRTAMISAPTASSTTKPVTAVSNSGRRSTTDYWRAPPACSSPLPPP